MFHFGHVNTGKDKIGRAQGISERGKYVTVIVEHTMSVNISLL